MDKLRDGEEVLVIWSGGNGPHRYEVRRIDGVPHAMVGPVVVGALTPQNVASCEVLTSVGASR